MYWRRVVLYSSLDSLRHSFGYWRFGSFQTVQVVQEEMCLWMPQQVNRTYYRPSSGRHASTNPWPCWIWSEQMKFNALDRWWPDTGRKWPDGARLEIRYVHEKWADLAWWSDKRDAFVYISTLPNKPLDNTENNGIVKIWWNREYISNWLGCFFTYHPYWQSFPFGRTIGTKCIRHGLSSAPKSQT